MYHTKRVLTKSNRAYSYENLISIVAWTQNLGYASMQSRIVEIEGIGAAYGKKFLDVGVKTTDDLLEAGSTEMKRKELAEKTGISHTLIVEWVNRSDLFRIKGVATQYSDLLEAAGVDTVVELSKRVAENLKEKIEQTNKEKRLVRRTPALSRVRDWIEQAKKLPRKVEY